MVGVHRLGNIWGIIKGLPMELYPGLAAGIGNLNRQVKQESEQSQLWNAPEPCNVIKV